jgi:hypothetical protein
MKTFTSDTVTLSEASCLTFGFSSANRAGYIIPDEMCTEISGYEDEEGYYYRNYTVDIKEMLEVEWVFHRSVLMDDGTGDRPVPNMLSGGKHGPVGPCFHYWKHPDL